MGDPQAHDTDWRTDTAERPRVMAGARAEHPGPTTPPPPRRPVVPPPAMTTVGPPRFPLFADEVTEAPQQQPAGPAAPAEGTPRKRRQRRGAVPVALPAAAVLVVVLGPGSWLLLRSPDSPVDATAGAASPATPSGESEPTDAALTTAASEPSEPAASSKPAPPEKPVSLVPGTRAQVPATAPPNEDVHGNTTTYEAGNMLDGARDTAWRMGGDGSGTVLTFTLPQRSVLTQVGLVNGYAKTSSSGGTTFDWYAGNRRVLAVEWVFDDGTTERQQLTEERALQRVKVEPVVTRTVRLRLLDVTAPGSGPAGRNYTALSEVALLGAPA